MAAAKVTIEQYGERPAWEVRVEGLRVGVVYRERRQYRAVREGYSAPEGGTFTSREAAARALARLAGHRDIDPEVDDLDPRRGRARRGV